jgi:lipopolysaccharide/colanic/teichoic acid biosynthesis glycosyltransferase
MVPAIHEGISRMTIVVVGVCAVSVFPLMRITSKHLLRKFGLFRRRMFIPGAGESGMIGARAFEKESSHGYQVPGILDATGKIGRKTGGIKIHKGIEMTDLCPEKRAVSDLVIAMPLSMFLKRLFDVIVSILLLPLLAVPMAAIALMIKLESEGPAIFSQVRMGKGGKLFRCFKFRTMHTDAEERLSAMIEKDPETRREWEKYWKLKDDPRVTRVGRILRETSLDELPQIFNVLRGEMSLVGPRPYLPHEKEAMGDFGRTILLIKPGISGLWQVSGRSTTSYAYRIVIDNWYVRNWHPWFDILIMLKTVGVVIKREGAC